MIISCLNLNIRAADLGYLGNRIVDQHAPVRCQHGDETVCDTRGNLRALLPASSSRLSPPQGPPIFALSLVLSRVCSLSLSFSLSLCLSLALIRFVLSTCRVSALCLVSFFLCVKSIYLFIYLCQSVTRHFYLSFYLSCLSVGLSSFLWGGYSE